MHVGKEKSEEPIPQRLKESLSTLQSENVRGSAGAVNVSGDADVFPTGMGQVESLP